MKVVHIESGLGNQMLSYSELLLLKKINNPDEFYLETIIYDIPECNDIIRQWYGYELDRIFGIDTPNIKTLFSDKEWNNIIYEVRKTKFWSNWNYPPNIVKVLNRHGLDLMNYRGEINLSAGDSLKTRLTNNRCGYFIKRILRPFYQRIYANRMSDRERMYLITNDNAYTGQWLGLMKVNSGIEIIEEEIRNTFVFPKITDDKNLKMKEIIVGCNSVAVHARRGDAMGTNEFCYKYGYFRRAVSYIKKRVDHPVFVFFTDPGSMSWCRENSKIFNLDFRKDKVIFVDWNKEEESYRDMQLMSYCKHNIITNSSFGWWGAFLNSNPSKITCAPSVWINTTIHL